MGNDTRHAKLSAACASHADKPQAGSRLGSLRREKRVKYPGLEGFALSKSLDGCALSKPQLFVLALDRVLWSAVPRHRFRFGLNMAKRLPCHTASGKCKTAPQRGAHRHSLILAALIPQVRAGYLQSFAEGFASPKSVANSVGRAVRCTPRFGAHPAHAGARPTDSVRCRVFAL